MLPDHPLGDAGLEQVSRAALVLVAEHDKVHVELLRALEDDVGDVMLRRTHDFPVGFDTRRSQAVNELLHGLPVHGLDIVLRGQHAEPRAANDVARNDVRAGNMQHVDRRPREPAYLLGPGQGRPVLLRACLSGFNINLRRLGLASG